MIRTASICLLLCMAALARDAAASAPKYACTADGHPYAGDEIPAECARADVDVLNPDGSINHVLPRPRTPEEIRRAQADEELRKQRDTEKRDQMRYERALLERYDNVEDLEAARQRDLGPQQQVIDRMEEQMKACETERRRLTVESEFYERLPKPDWLKRAIKNNEELYVQSGDMENRALHRMNQINDDYDARRKLYLELKAAIAAAKHAHDGEQSEQARH